MNKGTLYWVTGLSGAGKTTIGTLLYNHIKATKNEVVFLDGDALRSVIGNYDYSDHGREQMSYTNMRLFKLLTDQGIDVVCCVIGMKEKYRLWNRNNVGSYREIYLKVSLDELIRRDPKGLYRKALNREIQNVYGVDLEFEEPQCPDLVIGNEGSISPEAALAQIVAGLNLPVAAAVQ